jgi:hypothetical protein
MNMDHELAVYTESEMAQEATGWRKMNENG